LRQCVRAKIFEANSEYTTGTRREVGTSIADIYLSEFLVLTGSTAACGQ
jgi:hypothetical protein